MSTTLSYDAQLKYAFQVARSLAREHRHHTFSTSHLLKAILHNDVGLASQLAAWDIDIHYLRDWADIRMSQYPKTGRAPENPEADEKVKRLLEVADLYRLKLGEVNLSPLAALIAMCQAEVAFSQDQLKTFPLNEKMLLESSAQVKSFHSYQEASNGTASTVDISFKSQKALAKYCVHKTELAQSGKIDPIIGRDKECRMMAEILGRRIKPNVLLIGEPGVGKTALVDGFAINIQEEKVPLHLKDSIILELDTGALIAGASYKGEIEDRLKNIIKEVKALDKAILFIDEIHVLLDPKGSAGGAANLLKPELARGELTVIGATTNKEFRKFIEKDNAFERRFELLRVEEPDLITSVRILEGLIPYYEEHHQIKVEPEAIQASVYLSKRYLRDKRLPDAAIDLLDRTMSSIRMMKESSEAELHALEEELQKLKKSFGHKPSETFRKELLWFATQIKDRLSPILVGSVGDNPKLEEITDASQLLERIEAFLGEYNRYDFAGKESLSEPDLAALISYKIGIPIGNIQIEEREKLKEMESYLKSKVIGQDHAIDLLASTVKASRAGLSSENRPVGSFFFLGPTGTGKTELAKALAEFLFGDTSFLIRFNMSEFSESYSTSSLIGSDAGLVGYEEGGPLVNKIREQAYSVVLFDEIEKAHPDVFKLFLQILDEGKLRDKLGKVGDFSNALIVFTSNIASDYIFDCFNQGFRPDNEALREYMGSYFKDEFLGRLDEIVPFAPISEENLLHILDIQLKDLHRSLERQAIQLLISPAAKVHLAQLGFSQKYGARPLRKVITNHLQKPLGHMISMGEIHKGGQAHLFLDEKKQLKWNIENK